MWNGGLVGWLTDCQDKRKKCLQSIEEPNYKLGILFLFPILENRETPPFSLVSFLSRARSNALTREFNQLDERTHSSTTKRESALGSPLKSPTTNEQIQARDTSEESSELRQQLIGRHMWLTLLTSRHLKGGTAEICFVVVSGRV